MTKTRLVGLFVLSALASCASTRGAAEATPAVASASPRPPAGPSPECGPGEWRPPAKNPRPYGFSLGEAPLDANLHLGVQTSEIHSCLRPLDASLDVAGRVVTVTLRGVAKVERCLGAAGPASRTFSLGELTGRYELVFVEGARRDRYTLDVGEADLRVSPVSASFTTLLTAERLVRVPPRVLGQVLRVECTERTNERCATTKHPSCAEVWADASLQKPFPLELAPYALGNFFTRQCVELARDAPKTPFRYFLSGASPQALVDRHRDPTPPPDGPCLLLRAETPALIRAMSW